MHGTRPAKANTAAISCTHQSKFVSQHPQKRHLRVNIGLILMIIDSEGEIRHINSPKYES